MSTPNRAARRREQRTASKRVRTEKIEVTNDIPPLPLPLGVEVAIHKQRGDTYIQITFKVPGWGASVLMQPGDAAQLSEDLAAMARKAGAYSVLTDERKEVVRESGLVVPQ